MPTPDYTVLADSVQALVGRRDLTQQQFANWLGGAVNGGPNSDGNYPLTDSTGFTRMVPCPARQVQGLGNGLDLTGFNALPTAVEADVASAPPEMLGKLADGTLHRFTTNLFAARRTKDLDVLPGSEYAEWLSCLSSTGLERKIGTAYLTRSFGDVIDPTRPPYNCRFDAQKMHGATVHQGSNLIDTPYTDFRFNQSDLGKICNISNHMYSGGVNCYIGSVSADGAQLRVFYDKAFTQPVNADWDRGYEEMIWGTDDTIGMQAAIDDADPRSYEDHGRTVAIGGFGLVSQLRFGSMSIVGMATTTCGFYHLASPGAGTSPWIAPKGSGKYYASNKRPHHYSLLNLSLFGQRYTVPYNTFRRALEIYGGGFGDVYTGASYARIEGIDIFESRWDGFFGDGVFAGLIKDFRVFLSEQCGMRVGFFDLNGVNWHAEGNKLTGIYSTLVGANLSTVRSSYNGANADGNANPHEHGSNYTEAGFGNTVTNLRLQESWSHSLCFTDVDTNYVRNGGGSGNAFYLGTFDDTADISSELRGDGSTAAGHGSLPDIRAMVYFRKTSDQYNFNSVSNNTVNLVTGSYQVKGINYATNAVGFDGYARYNEVTFRTPKISNDPTQWYDGVPINKPAFSRGPWASKNTGTDTIGSLANTVKINGQLAP
jgi:hypothetical protein